MNYELTESDIGFIQSALDEKTNEEIQAMFFRDTVSLEQIQTIREQN